MADKTGYILVPEPPVQQAGKQNEHRATQALIIVTQDTLLRSRRTVPVIPSDKTVTST